MNLPSTIFSCGVNVGDRFGALINVRPFDWRTGAAFDRRERYAFIQFGLFEFSLDW